LAVSLLSPRLPERWLVESASLLGRVWLWSFDGALGSLGRTDEPGSVVLVVVPGWL
jgi:hypothetical protein